MSPGAALRRAELLGLFATIRTGAGSNRGPADKRIDETLDDALARFAACREATLGRVGALDEAGWSRSGTHETSGVLDVGGLAPVRRSVGSCEPSTARWPARRAGCR